MYAIVDLMYLRGRDVSTWPAIDTQIPNQYNIKENERYAQGKDVDILLYSGTVNVYVTFAV